MARGARKRNERTGPGPAPVRRRWALAQAALAILPLFVLLGAPGAACSAEPEAKPAPADTAEITILHTNDMHGQLEPYAIFGKSTGGFARLATLVADLRARDKSDRLFLLDSGDVMSRGDDLSRKTLGQANFALMNRLKYDLWVPGNGDFYDGLPNLQDRMRQAEFQTLAANVKIKASGEPLAKASVVEKAGPVRVALFGLCFFRSDEFYAAPLVREDPIETATALVPKLRRQADVVILVSHCGYVMNVALARAVPGIDLIVSGHTHLEFPAGDRVKDPAGAETLIVETGEGLANLGEVHLKFRKADGRWKVASSTARLIPLDDTIKLDPAVTAQIARMTKDAANLPMPPDPYKAMQRPPKPPGEAPR